MIYVELSNYSQLKQILNKFAYLEPHGMAMQMVDITPVDGFTEEDIKDILSAHQIQYFTENFDFKVQDSLHEADGENTTGGEEYKGIFIDRKTGNFKILTGRFPDKKAMIRKYGVLGKGYIVRKVFERSVFDWINKNAQNAIEAYLMFSTAFSKWKDIDILQKYYTKLIDELPQLFKNVRDSDVITQKQTNKTKNPTAQKTKSNDQESIQEADDLSAAEKHDYILNQATYDDIDTMPIKRSSDLKKFVIVKREYYDDLDNLIEVNNTPLKYLDKEENKYFNKQLLGVLSDTFSFGQLKHVKKIGVFWENKISRKRNRGMPNETAGATVDQYDVKYYLASDFDALSYAIYDNLNIDENTQITKLVDSVQYENMQEEAVIDIAGKKLEDSDCKTISGRWFFYEDEKEMVPEVPELNKFYDEQSLLNIPPYIMNAAFLGALRGSSLLYDYFRFQIKRPFTFSSLDGNTVDIKYEKNKNLLKTLDTYFLDYNLWNNGLTAKTTKEMYDIDPQFVAKQLKSVEKKDWNKDNYSAINESNKNTCRKKFFDLYASEDVKNLYSHHFDASVFEDLSNKCNSVLQLYKILYPNNNKQLNTLHDIDEPLSHMANSDEIVNKIMEIKQYIIDNFIKKTDEDLFHTTEDICDYLNDQFGAIAKVYNASKYFKQDVNKQLIQISKDNIQKSKEDQEEEISKISKLSDYCLEFIDEIISLPLNNMKDINTQIEKLHVNNFIKEYNLDKNIVANFIDTEKLEEFFTNIANSIANEKHKMILSKNFRQSYQEFIDNLISSIKQQYGDIQKTIFTPAFLGGKYQKLEDIRRNQILMSALDANMQFLKQVLLSQLNNEYYKDRPRANLEKFSKSTLQVLSELSKDEQFLSELNRLIDFVTFLSKAQMTTDGSSFYFRNTDNGNKLLRSSQIDMYNFYQGSLSEFYKTYVEDKKIAAEIQRGKAYSENSLLNARYSNEQYNNRILWDNNRICKSIDESDEFIQYLNGKDFSLDIDEHNYQDKSYIINLYIDNNINNCQKKLFDFSSEKYYEAHNPDQNEILKSYHFNPTVEDSYSSIDFLIKYIQEEKLVKDVFDFFLRNKMRFYDNFQPDVHGREMPAAYNIGQSISAKHFNVYKIGKEIPKYMVQEFQLRVPKKIADGNSVLRYLNTNPGKTRKFVSYLLSAMNTKHDKKSIVVEFFPNNATRYSYTKELYNDPEYYTDKNTNFITTYYTTREKLEQSYNTQETTNNRNLMYHILFDIIKEEDTPNGFTYKIVPDNILLNKTHKTDKETGERYYQLTSGQVFLPLADYVKQNVVNKGMLLKQRDNMTPEEQEQFDREIKLLSDQYDPTQPEYYSRMKANLSKNRENKNRYLQSIKIEDLRPFDDQTFEKVSTTLKKVDDGEVSLPSDICTYLNLFLKTKTDWKYWGVTSDRKFNHFAKVRKSKYNPDYIDMEPQYDHIIHTADGQMAVKPDKDVEKPVKSTHTMKKEPKNGKIGDFQ